MVSYVVVTSGIPAPRVTGHNVASYGLGAAGGHADSRRLADTAGRGKGDDRQIRAPAGLTSPS